MKNFLKENWFKVTLVTLFFVCVALLLTYGIRQQNIQKQTQLNSLNSNCEKLASQKKEEMLEDKDFFFGNIYEYKYNPTYGACFLAYRGMYLSTGLLSGLLGRDIFEIRNLTTGQVIMSERVNPGDAYRKANEKFTSLREQYIGIIPPTEGS